MIGLDLLSCIRDLVEDPETYSTSEIEKIFTDQNVATLEQRKGIIAIYRQLGWSYRPKEAEEIFQTLFKEGKIVKVEGVRKLFSKRIDSRIKWVKRDNIPSEWLD